MEEQQEPVEIPKSSDELKKYLKTQQLVYGTDRTLKLLKLGKLSKMFISSNVPEHIKEDCEHYSRISGIEIVKLEMPNDELGTFCKKPFAVSVIGLLK